MLSALLVGPVTWYEFLFFLDHEWLDNVIGFPVDFMEKNQDDDDEVDKACDAQGHKELSVLKVQGVPWKVCWIIAGSDPFLKQHNLFNHYV